MEAHGQCDVGRGAGIHAPSVAVALRHRERGQPPRSACRLGEVHNWGVFLRFLYHVPYGANDPLYDKDIGFYLFALPAYVVIKNWMLLTLLLSALFAGAIYWVHGHIEYDAQRRSMSPTAIAHGSVLLGFFFAVKAWSYGLDRYLLLYHDNGVVVGASYTDIHVELPVLWLLIGLSTFAAFASWANLRVFGGSFVLSGVVPALFQRLFVKPDELRACSSRLQPCRRACRSTFAIRRTSS
jgi:uncharacterized protein